MKKFVSVLLVLCCLMASCVSAFAERQPVQGGLTDTQVVEFLSILDDSIFDSVSISSNMDNFDVKIIHDNFVTYKNCYPSAFQGLIDRYTSLFIQFARYIWLNYSTHSQLTVKFVDVTDKQESAYYTFTAFNGKFSCYTPYVSISKNNNYVKAGANPAILRELIDTYGVFKDDYMIVYSADSGYSIITDSIYPSIFTDLLNDGDSAALNQCLEFQKYLLSKLVDKLPCDKEKLKITVLFQDPDSDDYLGYIGYDCGNLSGLIAPSSTK